MDGLILRYLLVVPVGIDGWAVFHTGRTARALALQDVPRLFDQRHLEGPSFPGDAVDFSIGEDLYIWMPADLDQLGREYSHGTVIGRKGLVKLGHMAPNAGRLLDQIDSKAGGGKI